MNAIRLTSVLAAAALLAAVARADDKPADDKPAEGKPAEEKLDALDFKNLSLRLEKEEFADDLKRSRSFNEDKLEKALKPAFGRTSKTPTNSTEMLERMAAVLAEVDRDFAKGYAPFRERKYEDAVRIWKDVLNPAREEGSYRMAVLRYYLGEAYRLNNQKLEAVFEYRSLALKMPKRFSPAGMARYRAGKCFEDLNRKIRATEEWTAFAQAYGTADEKLLAEVEEKLKDWTKRFGSLSGIIDDAAAQMGDVKNDLSRKLESGKPVQEKQERISGLLDDLILTLEEKEKEKDGGGGGGGGGGSGSQSGQQGGMAGGAPNAPAANSSLPGGETGKVGELNTSKNIRADDGWGRLPPREKERILNAIKVQFPDRYNEIVKEYLKGISGTDAAGGK